MVTPARVAMLAVTVLTVAVALVTVAVAVMTPDPPAVVSSAATALTLEVVVGVLAVAMMTAVMSGVVLAVAGTLLVPVTTDAAGTSKMGESQQQLLAQTAVGLAGTTAESGVVILAGLTLLLVWLPGTSAVAMQMLLPVERI